MKRKFTHKLIVLLLGGLCLTLGINAQEKVYQLPDPGFEKPWIHGVKLDGKPTTKDADKEPVGWHSFATASGNSLFVGFASNRPEKKEIDNTSYVRIYTKKIVTANANGNLTTGRINAANMTPDSPKDNYNYTPLGTEGKGAEKFRQQFNGRPDGIALTYWHIPKKNNEAKARIAAWIHNGKIVYKDPVPNNESSLKNSNTVAGAEKALSANNTFESVIIPFDYESYIGYNNEPECILVTLTSNETPGGGDIDDELRVNRLEFVYYSTLTDLKIDGISIPDFDESVTEYIMEGDAPELADITVETKSPWATSDAVTSREEDDKIIYSVTVKGNDFEASGNQTTYELIYTKKVVEPIDVAPIVGEYGGNLTLAMPGGKEEDQIVTWDKVSLIEGNNPSSITLLLKDFIFTELNLGDIKIDNIPVELNESVYSFENESVRHKLYPRDEDGDIIDENNYILADVKVSTGTVVGDVLDVKIDVVWIMTDENNDPNGSIVPIAVSFKGIKGAENSIINKEENAAKIYTIGNEVIVSDYSGIINVYNLSGVKVYSQQVNGSTQFSLDRGLYIIKADGKAEKIFIK